MPQETTAARYLVFCGKPTTDGSMFKYEFQEQAPTSLCQPHKNEEDSPDPDATGTFITSLVDRYQDEILRSRPWHCVICDKPAKEILHHAIPLLSPSIERKTRDFVPTVLDTAGPICISGGACDRQTLELLQHSTKTAFPWGTTDFSSTCDKCGKKSGIKLCSGCKLIGYCSVECQAQSWPLHKRQCKNARKESGKH